MKHAEIMQHIDHTLLKAAATWQEIQVLCEEAIAYGAASVCVPASYISRIRRQYGDKLTICTVVGFPLGYSTTQAKIAEVAQAVADGVDEVDMVINIGDVKNGDFDKVTEEIAALKQACGGRILKVIVETCYLNTAEKIKLCGCVTKGGADFIKTSTGFGTSGATVEDVRLFKEHIGPGVRVKAAGGIRTVEDLELFLQAGCERIGTSSAVTLLKGGEAGSY